MRCAIYTRYSSDQQSPLSITDQIRKCREYAEKNGWRVVDAHIYRDEAISGVGLDRAALTALLAAAETLPHAFEIVLVDDQSRLSRGGMADSMNIHARLKFAGIRWVAVSQGIDSDSDQADVLVGVHGLVDSLYIKELGKKTHRGLEGCVIRGMHTGGRCFGYRSEAGSEGVRLVVVEEEACVVRRIFEMCADGKSLKTIAKILNAERVPSPRPRAGKQYATWCLTAIHEMLRRERYIGQIIWNRARFIKRPGTNKRVSKPRPKSEWKIVEQPELRIVSEDLWARVQARLVEVKEIYGRGDRAGLLNRAASSPCLFTGFLKCGFCGANMVIVTGRGKGNHRRYGCPQNYYRGACTNGLKERQDLIEDGLLSGLQEAVLRPEVVDYAVSEFGRQLKAALGDMASQAGRVKARREELKGELGRLTAAIAEGGHSQYLLQAIADRERELNDLVDRQFAGPESIEARAEGLRRFVEDQLQRVRELLYVDVAKARAELSKHAREIHMVPEGSHYVARGEWNLAGGYAERVRLVAGEGFEPSTFGL